MSTVGISERRAVVENIDCYENLANAIILQAVKDYKSALHRLEEHPGNREARHDKRALEYFFHSQWYGVLTDLDPERLISGVEERVRKETVERRKRKAECLRRKAEKDRKQLWKMLVAAGAELEPEKIKMLQFG